MKKVLITFMIVSLVLASLIGCSSSKDSNAKTEEERRAEIQAELEAEMAAEAAETEAEKQAEQPAVPETNQTQQSNTQPVKQNTQTEQQSTPTNQTQQQPTHTASTVYQLKQLSKGDRVGPFIVESSKISGVEYAVVFRGDVTLSGRVGKNEMTDLIGFSSTNSENAIMIDYGNGVTKDVLQHGTFADNHHPGLSESTTFAIEGFAIYGNGYAAETIVNYKGAAGSSSSSQGKLTGYKAETIDGTYVNYSDLHAVIVPMYYDGVNRLESVTAYTGSVTQGAWEYLVNFRIFGVLEDIEVTFYEGMDSNGHTFELGTYSDVNLNVHLFWNDPPNDMSYMKVTGKVPTGGGNYAYVDFTLDTMRSDYDVITVK